MPATLPVRDTECSMRSTEETIARILAMNAVAAATFGFDKGKAIAWLNREEWAMGMADKLDFSQGCDSALAAMLPNLKENQGSSTFRDNAHPRPVEEIVAVCDLAYCLHW